MSGTFQLFDREKMTPEQSRQFNPIRDETREYNIKNGLAANHYSPRKNYEPPKFRLRTAPGNGGKRRKRTTQRRRKRKGCKSKRRRRM
jgi:hypothetical protein